jgi:hypothetical protein
LMFAVHASSVRSGVDLLAYTVVLGSFPFLDSHQFHREEGCLES